MISSRSFEVEILQAHQSAGIITVLPHEVPARRGLQGTVRTDRQITTRVQRSPADVRARLRLGSDLAGVLNLGVVETTVDLSSLLREQCGEALLILEMEAPDIEDAWLPILELAVPLAAPPALEKLYEALITDLESVHVGLARDIVGRTSHTARARGGRIFEPAVERDRLESWYQRLSRAMTRIGVQPSSMLIRERRLALFRAGDVPEPRVLSELPRDPKTEWREGRPVRLGRVALRTTRLTTDLPEHRHLRAGILMLARRGRALADGCFRAAALLREEERAWNHGVPGQTIFETRDLPRIRKLEEIATSGEELETRFRRLVTHYSFLREAANPRTRFGPTPLFLGRRGYDESYRILVEARREQGFVVDGQAVRIIYRGLDKLYEYWTYVKAVAVCRELLGPVSGGDGFTLIHELYRPELVPGQSFWWDVAPDLRVEIFYEPAIPPAARSAQEQDLPWLASLVGAPLRPDVLLVVYQSESPPRALVIDAKSTAHFDRERLFAVSDYRTLIFDPATVSQPVRQTMLVHRDTKATPSCSLPGYFEGRLRPDPTTSILGAVPLLPGDEGWLRLIINQFLELEMGMRGRTGT